nr:tumor necrosis factor ligand superfamily member 6 isoform X2 [Pogona vitticeps]
MQQNQHCTYPQVFWTNSSGLCSSDYALSGLSPNGIVSPQDICPPLAVPVRKRFRQNTRDGACLCFLMVFLLTFLALTGVGLAMFQIFHLQQELNALKEISSSGPALQSPEMLKGFLNGTTEKKVKRRAHLTGKGNQQSLPLEWESTYGHAFISGVHYKNRNPAYPDIQVLMEDKKMNYCSSVHMWGKSSYLGASFNLSRQDSLYVSVSDVTLVNFEESKTFFGLFML